MRLETIDCPRCDSTQECFLVPKRTRHLRQCARCELWYLIAEGSERDDEKIAIESLGDPPTCPVEDCRQVVADGELSRHIVDRHSG